MAEYLLTSSIDSVEKGQQFDGQLPLHVTIQQNFTLERERAFVNALQNYALTKVPFEITGTQEDYFGANNDRLVRRVKDKGNLGQLHRDTSELINNIGGGEQLYPSWSNDGYTPHVTPVSNKWIQKGDIATIRSLELIRKDEDVKTVLAVLALGRTC